ncbi:hypothetical protein LTR10_014951 [Elasticomyces elasticus]|nr:hypothetical protein LTR10_014951 [Elasticomyces elasticus]KAK4964528.1 hypothetical protein LTR42_012824 [Elasticomyces elasticus]
MARLRRLGWMHIFTMFHAVSPVVSTTFQTATGAYFANQTAIATTNVPLTISTAFVDDTARWSSYNARQSSDEARLSSDEVAFSSYKVSESAVVSSQARAISSLLGAYHNATAVVTSVSGPTAPASAPTWDRDDPSLVINDENKNKYQPTWSFGNWLMLHRQAIGASPLGEFEYYQQEHLGHHDIQCGLKTPVCGCEFDEDSLITTLQRRLPHDLDKAREVLWAFKLTNQWFKEMCLLTEALEHGGFHAALFSGEFAQTFFQQYDVSKVRECEAQEKMISAVIGTATLLTALLTVDLVVAIGAEVSIAGIDAFFSEAGLVTDAERASAKLFWTGRKLNPEWKEAMEAVRAAASKGEVIPKGAAWQAVYGGRDLAKWSAQIIPFWASNYASAHWKNEMVQEKWCDVEVPKDNRFEDMTTMENNIALAQKDMVTFLSMTMQVTLNGTGTGENGTYVDNEFSEWPTYLIKNFGPPGSYERSRNRNLQSAQIQEMFRKRYLTGLIQKAWTNQQCYMLCGPRENHDECKLDYKDGEDHPEIYCPPEDPNIICQDNCWQGIK